MDDALIAELLRLDGPVQAVGRTATRDHVVNDVVIRAGEPVLVVLAAANRDPVPFGTSSLAGLCCVATRSGATLPPSAGH